MKNPLQFIFNFFLLAIIIFLGYLLFIHDKESLAEDQNIANNLPQNQQQEENLEKSRTKVPEKEIRSIYITSYTASNKNRMEEIIDFIKATELNSVIIDIKDYSGTLAYDSQIEIINQLGNDRDLIKDLPQLIKKLHQQGIYVIARQTVFQDPELTKKKPEWAVKNSVTGGLWYDWKGLSWADASIEEVWNYNLAIAKEAINLGFDEINFDYIRFPSDGPMAQMQFANLKGRTKAEVMRDFYKFLHENLNDEPAYISGDLFGLTTERNDDMNIGQQLEDAILYFDYVCPMVYPSHYPSGYLNIDNPAASPYPVIKNALEKGQESIAGIENRKGKIRPWLQAFNMGAVYTPAMIDAQIKAAAEAKSYGYFLWNARNVYNYAPKDSSQFIYQNIL